MRELFLLTHANQTGHTPRQQTIQGRAHRQGVAGGGRSHAEEEAGEGNRVDDGEKVLNAKRWVGNDVVVETMVGHGGGKLAVEEDRG